MTTAKLQHIYPGMQTAKLQHIYPGMQMETITLHCGFIGSECSMLTVLAPDGEAILAELLPGAAVTFKIDYNATGRPYWKRVHG
jgi:hypothetical protein